MDIQRGERTAAPGKRWVYNAITLAYYFIGAVLLYLVLSEHVVVVLNISYWDKNINGNIQYSLQKRVRRRHDERIYIAKLVVLAIKYSGKSGTDSLTTQCWWWQREVPLVYGVRLLSFANHSQVHIIHDAMVTCGTDKVQRVSGHYQLTAACWCGCCLIYIYLC